jgi:hypothetical protein
MSDDENTPTMYDLANEFINLANQMAEKDRSGNVGTAIRFAASRFNAFEASHQTDDLAKDREEIIENFSSDFRKMMEVNVNQYIDHIDKNGQPN